MSDAEIMEAFAKNAAEIVRLETEVERLRFQNADLKAHVEHLLARDPLNEPAQRGLCVVYDFDAETRTWTVNDRLSH